MHGRFSLLVATLLAAWLGHVGICAAQQPTAQQPAAQQRGDGSATATADPVRDEKARQLFSAGVAAYSEGHYENALENYQLAFELSDRPQLLFNIGIAAERLRRDQEAFDAFTQYLERLPDADNRAFVEERLGVLRQALASTAGPASPQSAPAAAITPTTTETADSGGILTKWWFWGIVGVAAVAVTTTVIVVSSGPEYQSGDVGGTVTTLVAR